MLDRRILGNHLVAVLFVAAMAAAPAVFSQTTWHVPDDIPTLQFAVWAAAPGDTIVLAEGEHCGAIVDRPLTITGASDSKSRIVSCPGSPPYRFLGGKYFYIGLLMYPESSGSTISHLTFDGRGWIDDNDQLALGIYAPFFTGSYFASADDLTIEHNRFLGGIGMVTARGSRLSINHNVFDGYTIDDATGWGGFGADIVSLNYYFGLPSSADNSVQNNTFSTAARDGADFPWLPDYPGLTFVGIAACAQNNLLVRANKFDIASDSTGDLFGAGLVLSDSLWWGPSENAVIVKNDGRGSEYALIVTLDVFGGTANTWGAVIRGNFGLNDVNSVQSDVSNRSISTLVECDEFGICQ